MPPKRASKRQAAKRPAPAVAPKQRRAESRPISTALPERSAQPPESSSQLSPTELGAVISQAISGALQSVGIFQANLAPAERDSGTNTQPTPQPTPRTSQSIVYLSRLITITLVFALSTLNPGGVRTTIAKHQGGICVKMAWSEHLDYGVNIL